MNINAFQPVTYSPAQIQRNAMETPTAVPSRESFGDQITDALKNVNNLQFAADDAVQQAATGNSDDTHKAVIAMQHALMAMDFTLQVRNKVLDAYQEIMKTQL